jgi:Uma2 family endonuclease
VDHDDFGWWARSTVRHFVDDRVPGGRVLGPEILMRLPRQRRRRLPDVMYVSPARASIVRPTEVNGPAGLVMEVVSPDSVAQDWREKYLEYAKGGVREYWVIDRLAGRMEAYSLVRSGKYAEIEPVDGSISSKVLDGYFLRTAWVLAPSLPRIGLVMRDMGVRI